MVGYLSLPKGLNQLQALLQGPVLLACLSACSAKLTPTVKARSGVLPAELQDPLAFSFSKPNGGDDTTHLGQAFNLAFAATAPDGIATTDLYYKASNPAGCVDSSLSGWTAFAASLPESTTSQSWTPPAVGVYYFCAKTTDEAHTLYTLSGSLSLIDSVKQTPTLSFDAPATSGIVVASGQVYHVKYTAADSDSSAAVGLYYKLGNDAGCNAAGIAGWTAFGGALAAGNGVVVGFTPPSNGNFYFCGKAEDEDQAVYALASDAIKVNAAPTIGLVEPNGSADTIVQNGAYTITWADSDPDDDADIALYYKTSGTGACSTGTLITAGLSEDADGASGSYSWSTATVAPNAYYICASISDGINPTVDTWSAGTLTINAAPAIAITAPATTNQRVAQDTSFTITMAAGDPDDAATFSLFYATTTGSDCSGGIAIASSLSKSVTTYSWDTTGIAPGAYYICASISDGLNAAVTTWSSSAVVIDARPELAVTTPTVANPKVAQNTSFAINLTASDADSAATVDLYYEGSADATCSGATLITSGLAKTATTYSWNTTGVTPGTYYICASISDGTNPNVYSISPGTVLVDTKPTLAFTSPSSRQNIEVEVNNPLTLGWTTADPEENASISLYYKTSGSGDCATSGTLIAAGLHEDSDTSYSWNTSIITVSGLYYLCALVDDGINAAVSIYDTNPIVLHRNCTWTGATDTNWTTATNWTACASGAPRSYDRILIPTGTPYELTISNRINFGGFHAGVGGGEIIAAAGGIPTIIANSYATIESSVTLKGATSTCTTCYFSTAANNTTIENGATVTLGTGISLTTGNGLKYYIGTATSAGHLQTVANPGNPLEYPRISDWFSGFVLQGTSTEKSSLSITGLYVAGASLGPVFNFVSNYQIDNFDDLYVPSSAALPAFLSMSNCSTSVFNDTNWTNWYLDPSGASGYMTTDAATCTGYGPITISGSGSYYGEAFERSSDHANVFSWSNGASFTCTWTGANGTSWTDPANWSNCGNGRGNYPDVNDNIIITQTPANQPVITAARQVIPGRINQGIALNTEGTISVSPGSTLSFNSLDSRIQGSIKIQGTTSNCTSCNISSGEIGIWAPAQLTLGAGISWSTNGRIVPFGGSLKTDSGGLPQNEWPIVDARIETSGGILDVNGLQIRRSGIVSDSLLKINVTNSQIKSLKNVIFDTGTTSNDFAGIYIEIADCNTAFLDTAWSGLDFVDGLSAAGRNIKFDNCSAITPGSITVSKRAGGVNSGYGAAFADDPMGIIAWQ